jgi:hypothetical protein
MKTRLGIASLMILTSVGLLAFTPARDHSAREVRRIRAHFDSVLVELTARDVAALTVDQRERRADLVQILARYRDRGVFPRNHDFATPTPYFVDRGTGTLCAVAHLLESTGRRDIVDRVARANNNVWVAELKGDREFGAWLDEYGLTLAEAARIQVPYVGEPGDPSGTAVVRSNNNMQLAIGGGLAGGMAVMNLMTNRDGHGFVRNLLGVASGMVSVGYAAGSWGRGSADPSIAATAAATGAISAFVAARSIHRQRQIITAQRDASAKVAVAPIVPTATSGAGVSVSVRF